MRRCALIAFAAALTTPVAGARDAPLEDATGVTRIMWRGGAFDPRRDPVPTVAPELAAAPDDRVYLVQYATWIDESLDRALEAAGATLRWYVPHRTRIVEMTPEARADVEALPFVRWVGPYHPQWRLAPAVVGALTSERTGDASVAPALYNVMVFAPDQKAVVAEAVRAVGGDVAVADAGRRLVRARLDAAQLCALAAHSAVAFIDAWGPYEPDMDIARRLMGADHVEWIAGYDGTGVRGEILDIGFNLDHPDFASRPLIEHHPVGDALHGASTTGICFGDGTGDPLARGLLPAGQGIVVGIDYMQGANRYAELGELDLPPYECVFQSCSVGSPRTQDYTSISADMDAALFDHDILVCQALGNSFAPEGRPEAWAKNIVAVGGVFHNDTETLDDDSFTGASTGPAADGRIKPDLHSFYDSVWTTGGLDGYGAFGGTSASTAIVAGYAGLFHALWADGSFGNPVDPTASVFANRPHMTTAKAMLVNTARQYDFRGTSGSFSRMRQGWGFPDLRHMYRGRHAVTVIDESSVILPLETQSWCVEVGPDAPAMAATLVYADPPGLPFSAVHRINDLTLRVTAPSGTVYWGNAGLDVAPWSSPDGAADTINTVENVFVESPEFGTWQVDVIAAEINEDGHVETVERDADFALVINRAPRLDACTADIDLSGAVDVPDLLAVIAAWGLCPAPCPTDIDGDRAVDIGDLLTVLETWGPCAGVP